jgi:hypothetical protein
MDSIAAKTGKRNQNEAKFQLANRVFDPASGVFGFVLVKSFFCCSH